MTMDAGALAEGFVSVTLRQLDLTAHRVFPNLNTWTWHEASMETPLPAVPNDVSLQREKVSSSHEGSHQKAAISF
jgi:hypothetical protein